LQQKVVVITGGCAGIRALALRLPSPGSFVSRFSIRTEPLLASAANLYGNLDKLNAEVLRSVFDVATPRACEQGQICQVLEHFGGIMY